MRNTLIESFSILGINPTDDLELIRNAYLQKIKQFHPDKCFLEESKQLCQEQAAKINFAYNQIKLEISEKHFSTSSNKDYFSTATKLYEKNMLESALYFLNKIKDKNDSWYFLNGKILKELNLLEKAYDSFKLAITINPKYEYRNMAYETAKQIQIETKKQNKFYHKIKSKFLKG